MSDWTLLETSKIIVSAATPITLAVFGIWLKKHEQINAELTKKRIAVFDKAIEPANDILCFYTAVGHWQDSDPASIIRCKRELDRTMYRSRYLWSAKSWKTYKSFVNLCFETYQGAGKPAALRLDTVFLREQLGPAWKDEWLECVSTLDAPPPEEVEAAYAEWARALAKEIGSRNSA